MAQKVSQTKEGQEIRIIERFVDISTDADKETENSRVAGLAQTCGLKDMSEAVRQMFSEIDLENVSEVRKFLGAGIVVSWALANNEVFKVPWADGQEPNGVFGASLENGYCVFRRGPSRTEADYISQINAYSDALEQLRDQICQP